MTNMHWCTHQNPLQPHVHLQQPEHGMCNHYSCPVYGIHAAVIVGGGQAMGDTSDGAGPSRPAPQGLPIGRTNIPGVFVDRWH